MFAKRRVILIIMDSVGAGELPDAGRYGDTGSHTLNHIFERYPQMNLPNLSSLGLASISGVKIAPFRGRVRGATDPRRHAGGQLSGDKRGHGPGT